MMRFLFVGAVVIFVAWLAMYVVKTYGWLDLIVFTSIGACMVFLILCAIAILSKRGASHG